MGSSVVVHLYYIINTNRPHHKHIHRHRHRPTETQTRAYAPLLRFVSVGEGSIPIDPMRLTLMPVCSNFFPSFGRTITVPLTDSPSLYKGAFSFLSFPPVLNSTMSRASSPSSRISISQTGLKKLAITGQFTAQQTNA